MAIGIREEHEALRASVRRWLESHCPPLLPRSLLEADSEAVPELWVGMAGQGWASLAVPEEHGGQGYGLLELAVVLEELGRAVAPGPFLTTAWAAALVPALVDPSVPAAVVLGGDVVATPDGGDLVLRGAVSPVLAAAQAEVLLVATGDRWCAVDSAAEGVGVRRLSSLDRTRRLGEVTLDGVRVPPARVAPGPSVGRARDLFAVLVAAEACGGAAWCVETASSYAKVREQFGRPIGQFQAVKHRVADMLVRLEQARAVAWDAAQAATDPEEASLAAAIAASVAPEAFFANAKDCIQVLGGIGFTWEHDAHLYLRRATVLRQLLRERASRPTVARLALGGARRSPHIDLPAEAEAHRAEVRRFLESLGGFDRPAKRRRMADEGYLAPHWPEPWGRGAGAVEQLVIDEEFARAGVRRPHLAVGAWALPTIITHGSSEQQERFVGPTLHGDVTWCQLFSEPGAGSDLASLATKAAPADGGWLLTGQKVWTTLAREADWGICLARTNPDVPKHAGITYFLVDMHSEGIDVRPLRELTGQAMFNEVFLSDVFVPDECVVGQVDGGWALARTTLANERVSMASGSSFGGGVGAVLELVATLGSGDDPVVLDQLGGLLAEAHSVAALGYRTAARALSGADPGPEASVRKLLGVEHDQRVQELGLTLIGPEGVVEEAAGARWSYGFLANRCLTIAGGTSEVQRNVIAERLLGLPRDPEPT